VGHSHPSARYAAGSAPTTRLLGLDDHGRVYRVESALVEGLQRVFALAGARPDRVGGDPSGLAGLTRARSTSTAWLHSPGFCWDVVAIAVRVKAARRVFLLSGERGRVLSPPSEVIWTTPVIVRAWHTVSWRLHRPRRLKDGNWPRALRPLPLGSGRGRLSCRAVPRFSISPTPVPLRLAGRAVARLRRGWVVVRRVAAPPAAARLIEALARRRGLRHADT
jgi:hypothetical protein